MFEFLNQFIVLHAGTSVVVSQSTLTLMLVVLGLLLLAIGSGLLLKNRESLLQHRWGMTIAVALTLAAILLVMVPSAYTFYTDPELLLFSSLSVITIIHIAISVPAVALGLLFAVGARTKKTKTWMRLAAAFWVVSLLLGVILFFVMQDLLLLPM